MLPAAVFVALTMALHFETGLPGRSSPSIIFPFLDPEGAAGPPVRAPRTVAAGALFASAWVTVPLLVQGRWAATNEILAHGPLVNGYGAKQVMAWLVTGSSSTPIASPSSRSSPRAGLVVCLWRWRGAPVGGPSWPCW